jgi:hypothetical protein
MPQNRSPYYVVGKRIHPRSEEALLDHAKTGDEYTFYPGTDFTNNPLLWQKEPIESIQEIKVARARQIREKYGYLVLFWSGGTDSHTILKTFVENGIKLDRIVYSLNGKWSSIRHTEFRDILRPGLKEYLHRHNYEVEIELVDLPEHLEEHALGYKHYKDGAYPRVTPNSFFFGIQNDDFGFRHYPPDSVVIIGTEKPTVTVHQNFWCWKALDQNFATQEANFENSYVDVEEFFFTDACPEIQIKLTWLKIKCLEERALSLVDLTKSLSSPLNGELDSANMKLVELQAAGNILYTACLEAMGYEALNEQLQSGATKQFMPGKWNEDLRRAYHHNENLLETYSSRISELAANLPEGTTEIDKAYEGVVPVPKRITGIWSNPIPVKPFHANRF